MKLEYGPPAPRGVTTMMAVGNSDPVLADRVNTGLLVSAGIAGVGWFLGIDVVKLGGIGAAVAFWSMRKHT